MNATMYQDSNLQMDERRHEVRVNGSRVSLTRIEWKLLAVFVMNPSMVISPEQIWKVVWNENHPNLELIKWHISNLRKKLKFPIHGGPFVTVRGFGYRYDSNPEEARA